MVLCELADVHRESGRYPLAVQHYQSALECQPVPPFARERLNTLRNLGRAYAQMERFDDARAAWTEALALSTDLPDQSTAEIGLTHYAIAEAYRSQGQFADAVRSYQEALQHHPPGSVARAASLRSLGQTLLAAGRPRDAIEPLRRALETERAQPQQANARLVLTLQMLAQTHGGLRRAPTAGDCPRDHEALVYMDRGLQAVALRGFAARAGAARRRRRPAMPTRTPPLRKRWRSRARMYRAAKSASQCHAAGPSPTPTAPRATWKKPPSSRSEGHGSMPTWPAALPEDLRATLDELERRRGALQAAQQSLALLDRSDHPSVRRPGLRARADRARARPAQPARRERRHDSGSCSPCSTRARTICRPMRATAISARWAGWSPPIAPSTENDPGTAEFACGAALESVSNPNVRWVIEQVNRALDTPDGG